MIAEGHLDAALVTMPIGEKVFFVHRICSERISICLRRDDPIACEQSIHKHLIADRLRVMVARNHHPLYYDELARKFAKGRVFLRPTHFVSSPAEMQFLVKIGVGFCLVRESVRLDPELTRRSISGLSVKVKTAFICHLAQQRPVLPLLAYRLAKIRLGEAETSSSKRPNRSVEVELPRQLQIFG